MAPVTAVRELVSLFSVGVVLFVASCDQGPVELTTVSEQIAAAKSGDVIIVPPGSHGELEINRSFQSDVIIRSETPLAAAFQSVSIKGSHIVFDGVAITGLFSARNSSHIKVINSRTGYWTEALFSSNVTIQESDVTSTINLEAVDGFSIVNNAIGRSPGGVNGDLIRVIGDSRNGLIENNSLEDAAPTKDDAAGTGTHADGIQFINRGADWPSDIVIRGNLIFDDPSTGDLGNLWMQPINVGGSNILIEQNLVMGGTPNTIIVANAYWPDKPVVVRNNTVFPWPLSGGGNIRVTDTAYGVVVQNNVSSQMLDQGNDTILKDNFIYSSDASSPDSLNRLFDRKNDGMAWKDYTPQPGSPVDFGSGYGALNRVEELLEKR